MSLSFPGKPAAMCGRRGCCCARAGGHFSSLFLCSSWAGVDPLASSKGFWAEVLGVGDFYYELGIVIVQVASMRQGCDCQATCFDRSGFVLQVCLQTRQLNGGIIGLGELVDRVRSSGVRTRQQVSVDDVRRAILKLQVRFPSFLPPASRSEIDLTLADAFGSHTGSRQRVPADRVGRKDARGERAN